MYKPVIDKAVDFLFDRQVILDRVRVNLDLMEDNILWGEFNCKVLRGDKEASKFLVGTKDNLVYIKQNNQIFGPFKKYFRLEFGDFEYSPMIENRPTKFMNLKRKLLFLSKRIYFHSKSSISHLFQNDPGPLTDFLKKFKKKTSLKNFGGVTFRVDSIKSNFIELKCFDEGGIFDDNNSNEGNYYPPQVMGEYYADAYSAYCFARRFLETNNKDYLDAAILALKFVKRTYKFYPAGIIWISRDFKNPSYIETLKLIKNHISLEIYNSLWSLVSKLREDLYEPTNVYALRFHWHSIRNDSYDSIAINRLKRDQLFDGLIKDDNDNDYTDACDLAYHNYSLACLARGLSYNYNLVIKDIFLKGVDFSNKILTKNGEVSYNGRAANSIYHLASAIYAFEYASEIETSKSDEFRTNCELMFNYLSSFQTPKGNFPTAMNNCIKERAAWNHSSTPYNALVAYFLIHANDLHKSFTKKAFSNKKIILDRYAVYSNNNYYLTFFSGCNRSYGWSGEMHYSGIAGICAFGIKSSIVPCLDETKNLFITDLPTLNFNNQIFSFYNQGKIIETKEGWSYKKETSLFLFKREYCFKEKEIEIFTEIYFKKDGFLKGNLIQIPLLSSKNINLNIPYENSGEIDDILNSRGKSKLLIYYPISKLINKGEKINYIYSIQLK
jgi:hypothetical protein